MNQRVLSRVVVCAVASAVVLGLPHAVIHADTTPQTLPFSQNWSTATLITTDDNWSGVPGIIGYRGDGMAGATAVNPATITADGSGTPVDVNANRSDPNTFTTGGVTEFDGIANPVVALQGSGTARAPHLVITLNTTGFTAVQVAYTLRDIDGSADNALQPVALQFRIGASGSYTNLPAGFVADASSGPSQATLLTPVSVTLPASADNQPLVQVRIITTDAVGSDEWIGIDDIRVTGNAASNTNPSGSGSANPDPSVVGGAVLLTVAASPGANPASTGLHVSADLSSIGGSSTQAFNDDGGNSFSFTATIAASTTPGGKSLPFAITDDQGRTGTGSIVFTVNPAPPPVGHPVISQIYGGGGNSNAVFQNDYLELYNPGTTPFDITGWSIQYASVTGTFSPSNVQPLAGVIAPGEYYLIALASGGAVGDELPVLPNVSGSINMSATTGKVALVSNGDALVGGAEGSCPSVDPDLIDFVGYGGANCREGTANAPAPSNTTALLRKNGGATDTDSNSADFLAGTPNPRRTSPIAEVGPRVQSTDPAVNGSNAPRDASITVTFSEDVSVDDGWFDIACASTGVHDDVTGAGGPRTFVVTPNVNFQAGEQCTVTLHKDSVHDVDLDDGGPNTDTLPADFVWSFTLTPPGTPPPYPADVHLTMGNPSGAVPDVNEPDNYLMSKPEYALSYNRDLGRPNWVSWHLDDRWAQAGALVRVDTFRPDPAVPAEWRCPVNAPALPPPGSCRIQATDFFTTGFDRGHMTPNADREFPNSLPINQATFLMSNMVAQAPDNNQDWWANLENYLRTLLATNEVYIVSGPWGAGGTGANGSATTLAGGRVTVPAYTWKVALILPKPKDPSCDHEKDPSCDHEDDPGHVSASTRTIAVIMPNRQSIACHPPDVVPPACDQTGPNDWQEFLVSVHDVEALTGYDFFSKVDPAVQHVIEAAKDGDPRPPGAADQVVAAVEDTPKDFTLHAVSASAGPLTYVIDSAPTHGAVTGSDGNETYAPVADFVGTDSFTFHVSDGVRSSNTSTVTIQVHEVNDPPAAGNDARTTDEDVPLVFAAADLTANDSAGPANEAGQTLTVTGVFAGATTHGTVALSGSGGQVTYVPEHDFNGAAAFTYEVCDDGRTGGLADPKCATGTVEVSVAATNDAPEFTFVPAAATIPELAPYTFTAQAHDTDSPSLTFSLAGAPAGAAIDPVTGQFSWTPTEAQGGTGAPYAFKVRVSDGIAATDADVVIAVSEVNTPPSLAVAGHYAVAYGQPLTFTAIASDPDIPAQALTYGLSGAVPAGAAIDASTGSFTWTPTAAQAGASYSFAVSVTDGISPVSAPVVVDVVDAIAPVLSLPGPLTATASSPSGAAVTYTVTASDAVDGPRPVTCNPASGSTFAIGTTTVSCTASDTHGNTASGSFTVKVSTPDVPGRMIGDAEIDLGSIEHDVDFFVQERASGADAGWLRYRVTTRKHGRDQEDRFESTAITSVSFFNVPGVSPGPRPASGVDTVSFSGTGRWNGRSGYRFDAVATDAGEPGRRRDSFKITVRDGAGHVVASVDAEITRGNIQSLRIWY